MVKGKGGGEAGRAEEKHVISPYLSPYSPTLSLRRQLSLHSSCCCVLFHLHTSAIFCLLLTHLSSLTHLLLFLPFSSPILRSDSSYRPRNLQHYHYPNLLAYTPPLPAAACNTSTTCFTHSHPARPFLPYSHLLPALHQLPFPLSPCTQQTPATPHTLSLVPSVSLPRRVVKRVLFYSYNC